jgi:hypothetical protein
VLAADHPEIRLFTVAGHAAYHHMDLVEGSWKAVTAETADGISAVGYYFARKLQEETHDADNVHPKDKLPVGERLARCALANHYGQHVVDSGPTLASVERLPGAIRLHFAHTDGGLIVKGAKLEEFCIASEDRK